MTALDECGTVTEKKVVYLYMLRRKIIMRKRNAKTTVKSTEAIAETAAKVKETVKTAAKKVGFCTG